MISILGFALYILVGFSVWKFDTVRGMIDQAMLLAPQLSVGMFTLYFYPLVLALFLFSLRKPESKHKELLTKQTNIAASVAVSLGLIGTFQGLTQMVSAIASSMSGEGDITEKMGSMINAISDALGAMSYAFLTSILGVAVSVLLILSLNFWSFRFKENALIAHPPEAQGTHFERVVSELSDIKDQHHNVTLALVKFTKNENDIQQLIHALERFVTTQNETSEAFKLRNHELIEHILTSQQQCIHEQMELRKTLLESTNNMLDLLATNHQEQQQTTKQMQELVIDRISKLEALGEKSLALSAEQNLLIKGLKDGIDGERARFKSTLKALAEQ